MYHHCVLQSHDIWMASFLFQGFPDSSRIPLTESGSWGLWSTSMHTQYKVRCYPLSRSVKHVLSILQNNTSHLFSSHLYLSKSDTPLSCPFHVWSNYFVCIVYLKHKETMKLVPPILEYIKMDFNRGNGFWGHFRPRSTKTRHIF